MTDKPLKHINGYNTAYYRWLEEHDWLGDEVNVADPVSRAVATLKASNRRSAILNRHKPDVVNTMK